MDPLSGPTKILSGIPSEYQAVWIQIRPDILSGLIWIQTICKGNQQTTLVGKKSQKLNTDVGDKLRKLKQSILEAREEANKVKYRTRVYTLLLGKLSSADFFSNPTFSKKFFQSIKQFGSRSGMTQILSGIPSEYQTGWIQIRPDILSGLIWVQTVCKGYQQTPLVGKKSQKLSTDVGDKLRKLKQSILEAREEANKVKYS